MIHAEMSGSTRVHGTLHGPDGHREIAWYLADELAIGILVNSAPVAVMMATPVDLEDLAMGFLLTEGIIAHADQIRQVLLLPTDRGVCVDVAVDPDVVRNVPQRAIEGRAGCGLCGMNALTDVRRPLPFHTRPALDPTAIARAFAQLADQQPLKAVNRSVHGAAIADPEGEILMVCEDVGRHNALDKVAGRIARLQNDPADGFCVMTSRCSFELVQKAATIGLGGLATMSAPTQLSLQIARMCGLPLACGAQEGVVIF